ncbi:hypothetical protein OS493_017945 [Desmophyllum pertusum]|uniref:Uncharacterized protein n=1 Tax=Desmophyllum pertusum TaxID=174260 RepID=A0A9X0CQU7_9CNID|nr:hypothetical protein OS493_017945 [Desmophyllum pertusum]
MIVSLFRVLITLIYIFLTVSSSFLLQLDFDDADEDEADEFQEEEEEETLEDGETDVEINVTDRMESADEPSEEQGMQLVDIENGNDVKPEAEAEPMETDQKDETKIDVELKVDQGTDEKNDNIEETTHAEVVEKSEEKGTTEVSLSLM